jgi:hypothetical protein
VLSAPGHLQPIGVGISLTTPTATAINVYVGLRLAALQAKIKAEESLLEASLVKQFVGWQEEVVSAINDKYVTAKLVGEIEENLRIELVQIDKRLERIPQTLPHRSQQSRNRPSAEPAADIGSTHPRHRFSPEVAPAPAFQPSIRSLAESSPATH